MGGGFYGDLDGDGVEAVLGGGVGWGDAKLEVEEVLDCIDEFLVEHRFSKAVGAIERGYAALRARVA